MNHRAFQRNTRQRQVILAELRKLNSHPSAPELYEIVRCQLPRISLSTVYRNLERLAQAGVIQKLVSSGTQSRFDGNPEQHCHIRCVNCGRVADAPGLAHDFSEDCLKDFDGYELLGWRLEFTGICPECKVKLRS